MKKQTQADKIRAYAKAHPTTPIAAVAKKLGIRYQTVYTVLKVKSDVKTPKKVTLNLHNAELIKESVEAIKKAAQPEPDNVNHPAHYVKGGIETIDFIESKGLNYLLGNVVKYITRADHKGNREEDLLKARWYLNREIAKSQKA
jgi:hypothetical protein